MAFAVYKKHYPPALHDEVWRLDKIGKDGAFHKRLNLAQILTVEDFLRLVVMDPQRLRNVKFLTKNTILSFWDRVDKIFSYAYCIFPCTSRQFFYEAVCKIIILKVCVDFSDFREWDVQQDVGGHSRACKNLCIKWKVTCVLCG